MDRSELKALVQELLIELLQPQPESDQWRNLPKAWQPLGYPSYDALYKDVQRGLFRQGKELRDRRKPGSDIARWQINLAAALDYSPA